MSKLTALDRVAKGIRTLDMRGPANWRDLINLDKLRVADLNNSVLSQVFGSHQAGLNHLNMTVFQEEHGFRASRKSKTDVHDLKQAWTQLLCEAKKETKYRKAIPLLELRHAVFVMTGQYVQSPVRKRPSRFVCWQGETPILAHSRESFEFYVQAHHERTNPQI